MDPQIIAFIAIALGAISGTVIPYLLKQKEEAIPFNMSYVYAMILSLVIAVFTVMPTEPDLTFKGLLSLFLIGVGLERILNKANDLRLKRLSKN